MVVGDKIFMRAEDIPRDEGEVQPLQENTQLATAKNGRKVRKTVEK
jgi:hypothetical protein